MSRTRIRSEFQVNNIDQNNDPILLKTDGSVVMLNDLDADTYKIKNLSLPSNDQDLVNKEYLQSYFRGLDQKRSVRVATTEDIDVNNPPQQVDGVFLEQDDRVLVHKQTDAVENGIYSVTTAFLQSGFETVFQSTDIDDVTIETQKVQGGTDIQHYAAIDRESGSLVYAIKNGNTWAVETVDNIEHDNIDLAVDPSGNAHIIAQSSGTNYHYTSSGGWTSMNGFTSPTLYNPSIDIDSNGTPHIVGAESGLGGELGRASKPSSTWNQETVDTNASVQSNDIIVDSIDNLHVAYRDDSTKSGKYGFYNGTWSTEVYSQSDKDDGLNCGIDVGPNDNPHISHYGDFSIWYSTDQGSGFVTEKVADVGDSLSDFNIYNDDSIDFESYKWNIKILSKLINWTESGKYNDDAIDFESYKWNMTIPSKLINWTESGKYNDDAIDFESYIWQ